MFYYCHHIGDFKSGASILERIERWLYRDMLEVCYDTEKPLPLDPQAVCDLIGARDDELPSVSRVLRLKFNRTEGGWVNKRCQSEIDKYHGKAEKASIAGRASAAARAEARRVADNGSPTGVERRLNTGSTDVEQSLNVSPQDVNVSSTNQEPRTKNHKPQKIKPIAPSIDDAVLFPGVSAQVIADFKAVRKMKKAAITETALQTIASEAAKAGIGLESALQLCCTRGWAGFKAEWITERATLARPETASRHSGFDKLNYTEGVDGDGRF